MADGRVWLITGASSGFGSAIAQAALAGGDRVVGAVRRPDRLRELIDAYPGRATAVAFDVTDTTRAAAVVQEVIDEHSRIDVLVNNAGRTRSVRWRRPRTMSSVRFSTCTSSVWRR